MSDYVPCFPEAADCEALRDYFEWHIQHGYAKARVHIDRRGLCYLRQEHHANVGVGIPPEGETIDPKTNRIFIRAVF